MPKDKAIQSATEQAVRNNEPFVIIEQDENEYEFCVAHLVEKFFPRNAKIVLLIWRDGKQFVPVD